MATQGDLRVVVTSDSSQFRRDMQANGAEVNKLGRDFARASSGGQGNNRLLELGRLAEDAAVGYSLGGLSMAMRSAGNNVTQLATSFGPLAGGIAGIGVAALAIAPTLLGIGTSAAEGAKGVDLMAESLKKLADANEQAAKRAESTLAFDGKKKKIAGSTPNQLMDMRDEMAANSQQVSNDQVRAGRRLRNILPPELEAQVQAFVNNPTVAGGDVLQAAIQAESRVERRDGRGNLMPASVGAEQIAQSGSLINDMVNAQAQQVNIQEQLAAINNEMPAANRRMVEQAEGEQAKAERDRRDAIRAEEERMRQANLNPSEKLGQELTRVAALQLGAAQEGIVLDQDVVSRQQVGALREFAKASGLLTPAGNLTGATRGSREDFSARIAAGSRDPALLLEKQLAEMQRNGATNEQIAALMRQLVQQAGAPEVVVEF
jgi:hypothetical protein